MKPVIIIAIAFVLLVPTTVFAQEGSRNMMEEYCLKNLQNDPQCENYTPKKTEQNKVEQPKTSNPFEDFIQFILEIFQGINPEETVKDISKTAKDFTTKTTEKLSETINEQLEDISLEYTPTPTSIEESKENIQYINQIRQENGRKLITFDQRAYDLALARVQDVNEYDYFEHTNPFTGTCADTWKHSYGFPNHQYVAENLADGTFYPDSAVDLWMTSAGHKANLLWRTHSGGATVCESATCVFLGVNTDRYGAGCY